MAAVAKTSGETLFHVLLALVVVIAVARGIGALFRRFEQPAVIGEVVAGILLGPSGGNSRERWRSKTR